MAIVTFGEILLRLTPPNFARIEHTASQAGSFKAHLGGAEANVASALAAWGETVRMVSAVPANALGDAAVRFLRASGIQTDFVQRTGERLGLYFYEQGAGLRSSAVTYDRKHSSITQIESGAFDWDEILSGAVWFHWTGITASVAAPALRELRTALQTAQRLGVRVSCDLNYRSKLWTEQEAQTTMTDLMQYVNVCISNEQDAKTCLNVALNTAGSTDEQYYKLAYTLKERFGFDAVALSVRTHDGVEIPEIMHRRALLLDNGACNEGYFSVRRSYRPIEDIGGGDAFAAGLIHGLLREPSSKGALEFAVAAAALKQTTPGDALCSSLAEVHAVAGSENQLKIVR